jgi:hypothetical protein
VLVSQKDRFPSLVIYPNLALVGCHNQYSRALPWNPYTCCERCYGDVPRWRVEYNEEIHDGPSARKTNSNGMHGSLAMPRFDVKENDIKREEGGFICNPAETREIISRIRSEDEWNALALAAFPKGLDVRFGCLRTSGLSFFKFCKPSYC